MSKQLALFLLIVLLIIVGSFFIFFQNGLSLFGSRVVSIDYKNSKIEKLIINPEKLALLEKKSEVDLRRIGVKKINVMIVSELASNKESFSWQQNGKSTTYSAYESKINNEVLEVFLLINIEAYKGFNVPPLMASIDLEKNLARAIYIHQGNNTFADEKASELTEISQNGYKPLFIIQY